MATEKIVYYSQFLRGHAMPSRTTLVITKIGQETGGAKVKHGQEPLLGFPQGRNIQVRVHIGLGFTRVNNFSELWGTVGIG